MTTSSSSSGAKAPQWKHGWVPANGAAQAQQNAEAKAAGVTAAQLRAQKVAAADGKKAVTAQKKATTAAAKQHAKDVVTMPQAQLQKLATAGDKVAIAEVKRRAAAAKKTATAASKATAAATTKTAAAQSTALNKKFIANTHLSREALASTLIDLCEASGDAELVDLAGKWRHGWVPLDAVAVAVKAKRYHGGGGIEAPKVSRGSKSRIGGEFTGERNKKGPLKLPERAKRSHGLGKSVEQDFPAARGVVDPRDAVRMKRSELDQHASAGSLVAKQEIARREARRAVAGGKIGGKKEGVPFTPKTETPRSEIPTVKGGAEAHSLKPGDAFRRPGMKGDNHAVFNGRTDTGNKATGGASVYRANATHSNGTPLSWTYHAPTDAATPKSLLTDTHPVGAVAATKVDGSYALGRITQHHVSEHGAKQVSVAVPGRGVVRTDPENVLVGKDIPTATLLAEKRRQVQRAETDRKIAETKAKLAENAAQGDVVARAQRALAVPADQRTEQHKADLAAALTQIADRKAEKNPGLSERAKAADVGHAAREAAPRTHISDGYTARKVTDKQYAVHKPGADGAMIGSSVERGANVVSAHFDGSSIGSYSSHGEAQRAVIAANFAKTQSPSEMARKSDTGSAPSGYVSIPAERQAGLEVVQHGTTGVRVGSTFEGKDYAASRGDAVTAPTIFRASYNGKLLSKHATREDAAKAVVAAHAADLRATQAHVKAVQARSEKVAKQAGTSFTAHPLAHDGTPEGMAAARKVKQSFTNGTHTVGIEAPVNAAQAKHLLADADDVLAKGRSTLGDTKVHVLVPTGDKHFRAGRNEAGGYVRQGQNTIHVSPKIVTGEQSSYHHGGNIGYVMPAARSITANQYVLGHELGHIVDHANHHMATGERFSGKTEAAKELTEQFKVGGVNKFNEYTPGGMSKYGRTSAAESYAEAFVQHLHGGKGSHPVSDTYSEKFGWGEPK